MNLDHVWTTIQEAPTYILSDCGRVKHWRYGMTDVRVRRTLFRKRKYVNLIVGGHVQRFYIDRLMKQYFNG